MIAVLKHELKNYFHSFTAYVFGAFLLAIVGIGSMLYNLQAAVSNFEYVLSFGTIIFVVIVPILTMRVIAEERKQKTDQLLYSLPITTTQVILGKYLALLVIYLIPLAIISTYPLIFAQFGDVYLPTSYGSAVALALLALALGAVVRYLTRNEWLAWGVSFVLLAAISGGPFCSPMFWKGCCPKSCGSFPCLTASTPLSAAYSISPPLSIICR